MKLFNEAGSITEIWEDKENNKEVIKKSTSIKRKKSKLAVMYENTFYNHPKLECVKNNVFGTLKGKRKITPSSDISVDKPSPQQPCSSENINTDSPVVDACTEVESINKIDLNSNDEYPEKLKTGKTPTLKTCLQRGKSDIRLNRTRRHTDYCMNTLNCRVEFTIPGEFLFCSEVEHCNNFASLYKRISSGSNLRRSMSTGTIWRPGSKKTDFDIMNVTTRKSAQVKEAMEDHKSPHGSTHNSSSSIRSTCEKLYSKKSDVDIERKVSKKESKNILAGELQSIIDNKHDKSVRSNTSRGKPERETSFIENSNSSNKKDESNLIKDPEQVTGNTRNPTNRRSQSCKSVQKRHSHLFNISKYLKDRHTQRSKSFATIREFSTHDARKTSSISVGKNENRKSYVETTNTDGQYNSDGQFVFADEQTRNLSQDIELSPIKTTRSFDINDTDSRGNSCLHHASSKGDISTIKYLLAQGGDVWVKNDEHRLPIDLAQNFQTAKLLSSATLFYSDQNEQRNERNIIETSKLNIAL